MKFSRTVAKYSGTETAFFVCTVVCVVTWYYGYEIDKLITIVTFLMTFLLIGAQNRDTEAMQLKLDELIKSIDKADDNLRHVEDQS